MDNERIEQALKEIENSLPMGQAQVRFDVYGGGVDESFIRGSRAGITRLGVRLIRAALQAAQQKSINGGDQIESNLDDIVHPESDVKFDWIELSDNLEGEPQVRQRTQRTLRIWGVVGLLFVFLAIITFVICHLR